MRKNLSGIVNYEKHHNFVPGNNNGQNMYPHNHNQSYSMGDYSNNTQQQQSNYGGFSQQQPQQNYQNPPYKANNFFSNNQQNNMRPVVQQQQPQINPRQQIPPVNNYQNTMQNIQNPYNQQGYRAQQPF